MTAFKRARSDEQRAARRRAILDTAVEMLGEMPVAELSLNELARRVGLAKSNVLRYFESREAVLLELLDRDAGELLVELEGTVPVPAGELAGRPVAQRCERLAEQLVSALAQRPMLCDLIGAQAAVLERNVSAEVAARFKRAIIGHAVELARLVRAAVPELGESSAMNFVAAALMSVGSVWAHTQPSAAMCAAYDSDPALAALRIDFGDTLREMLAVLLAGLLARQPGYAK